MQMGIYGVQMKGVLPWFVLWVPAQDFYPALAALVSPVQKFFFLTTHFFTLCVPIPRQPGRAGVRLLITLEKLF